MKLPRRVRRGLEHWRRARHPVGGWRKWALIGAQGLAGFVVLFAAVNLTLSLSTFRGENPLERTRHELTTLWFSPPGGRPVPAEAFPIIYGDDVVAGGGAGAIHDYFARELDGGVFVLDHVMVDRMRAVNGGIDAAVLPTGVYVGAHALGPDEAPLVHVTKWLAHYLLFPRHAYILVVPQAGPAMVFSASQEAKFPGATDHPDRLSARLAPFSPEAYDFPSSGEAIHEVTLLTRDPGVTAQAVARLDAARARLEASRVTYGLLAPNSNTVVGCTLEEAGLMTHQARTARLLALRAPGLGADCPAAP